MKRAYSLLLFLMWICTGYSQSPAPRIVSPAGTTYQGNAMQIDWTLGELAITTIENSSRQITQGFHQANYTITSVDESLQEIGVVAVYPNPTSERLEIEMTFDQNRHARIRLMDLNGRPIWILESNGKHIEREEDLSNLPDGTYLLHLLIDGNQYAQTFKILKIS